MNGNADDINSGINGIQVHLQIYLNTEMGLGIDADGDNENYNDAERIIDFLLNKFTIPINHPLFGNDTIVDNNAANPNNDGRIDDIEEMLYAGSLLIN
jgi:hypothetical protein